jgi:hypothetical protein
MWDAAAEWWAVDAVVGPGDWGRADIDGVPVRLRRGEPGWIGGVLGRDGTC